MSNLPVPAYHSQLPAFLRDPSLFEATDKAIAGIGGGMPPYISIRSAKFHLVSADGEEAQVNQLSLDVIVLGGNEHVSKAYYSGAYDPAQGGGVPPTCFSDNGTAPSTNAMTPQAPLCAGCQFNAWGSKVTPSGSQVKACTDSKKLAVVLAADTPILVNGAASVAKALDKVYLLRVPAASMKGWRDYAKDIRGRGVPIIGVVTHLEFDAQASYPALLFKPTSFVNEDTYKASTALLGSVPEAVGANDVPRTTGQALPQTPPAHLTAPASLAPPPAPAPLPLAPPPAPAPLVPPPQAQQEQRSVRTRGAPRKDATPPASAVPPPSAAPSLFGNGSAVIVQPAPAGNELDALLAEALK